LFAVRNKIFSTKHAVVSSNDDTVPVAPTHDLLKMTRLATLAVPVNLQAILEGGCGMRYFLILGILFCGIAHAAPRCNPGEYSPTVNWQVGVASDQSIVSILWCNDAESLEWWGAGWNPMEAPVNSCAGNIQAQSVVTMMAAFWGNCLAGSGSLTSPQQTAINRLVGLWMPKLETPAVEPVYQYDAGALVGSAQGSVAAHTPCLGKVVASVHGVYYYNVASERYQTGGVIPAHMAAVCQLVTPPQTGWPQ
jgi:hypothetical protein